MSVLAFFPDTFLKPSQSGLDFNGFKILKELKHLKKIK